MMNEYNIEPLKHSPGVNGHTFFASCFFYRTYGTLGFAAYSHHRVKTRFYKICRAAGTIKRDHDVGYECTIMKVTKCILNIVRS